MTARRLARSGRRPHPLRWPMRELVEALLAETLREIESRRRLPESTYRLQLHAGFTFRDAERIAPYLHDLGVTHAYASPYLKARPGSTHGYDIIDHSALNPEIGTDADHAIRIGHLTPLTGFLGPLGEYAVMGVKLAAEEINGSGGVMGRKIELVMEDSVNPQTASAKAERLIERDKVAMIIGEISSASGLAI